jgi:hypothetical protein
MPFGRAAAALYVACTVWALGCRRRDAFSDRQRWVAVRVTEAAARWTRQQGYPPPYWVLLDLARTATEALRRARPSAQL